MSITIDNYTPFKNTLFGFKNALLMSVNAEANPLGWVGEFINVLIRHGREHDAELLINEIRAGQQIPDAARAQILAMEDRASDLLMGSIDGLRGEANISTSFDYILRIIEDEDLLDSTWDANDGRWQQDGNSRDNYISLKTSLIDVITSLKTNVEDRVLDPNEAIAAYNLLIRWITYLSEQHELHTVWLMENLNIAGKIKRKPRRKKTHRRKRKKSRTRRKKHKKN